MQSAESKTPSDQPPQSSILAAQTVPAGRSSVSNAANQSGRMKPGSSWPAGVKSKAGRAWLMVALVCGGGSAAVVYFLIFAAAAGSSAEMGGAASAAPLPVATNLAGAVYPQLLQSNYAGMLIARRHSALSFERNGRITQINVEEGDEVAPGDLLGLIDLSELDATKQRVDADLAAAESLLEELIAGPRQQTIDAAAARVGGLQARLELAESISGRETSLVRQGAGSSRTLDAAKFGEAALAEDLRGAKAELELLRAGTRAESIAAQRASCDSFRGRLAEIESQRRDGMIVAPFAGRLATRDADPGVVVSAGTPILSLISHEIEGKFGIPPQTATTIRAGSAVRVTAGGETAFGVVRRLEPIIDQATRTRGVYVGFDDIPDRWISGQVATIHIDDGASGSLTTDGFDADPDDASTNRGRRLAFWVPDSALARGGRGIWTLLVLEGTSRDAVIQRRAVELRRTETGYSLVSGMVSAGERFISSGVHRVTPGMTVRDFGSTSSSEPLIPSDARRPLRGSE